MRIDSNGKVAVTASSSVKGVLSENGALRITPVTGNSFVGAYAPDGSLNVVAVSGSSFVGLTHPSGALNAVEGSSPGFYHASGALNTSGLPGASILASTYDNAVAIDFRDGFMVIKDTVTPANAYVGPITNKVSFSRATAAYYFDDNNVFQTVASGVLRTTPQKGALIERPATNLVLNSTADGANLSTQSVAVTAQPYTLSFYGTGTIALSGATTNSLVGTGAFPTRVSLTFTPSAGTLTLTVSGTVQYAQLEAGTCATSFIPTAGSSVTRNADAIANLPSTAFNLSQTAGSLYVSGISTLQDATTSQTLAMLSDGTGANRYRIIRQTSVASGRLNSAVVIASAFDGQPADVNLTDNTAFKFASAWQVNDMAQVLNGGAPTTDSTLTPPTSLNRIEFGMFSGGSQANMWVKQILYVPQRVSNATLQALTT